MPHEAKVTIDEAQEMLDEIASELPDEFFEELNGGILLLPDTKLSPYAQENDLYIMGEYCYDHAMGRYINIYYGSFGQIYGYLEPADFKEQLRETLYHEFTHHVESLSGEWGLEIKDAEQLAHYKAAKS